MNVRIIVPRRADGGERDRIWRFCQDYWQRELPAWAIVEGHHDDGPFNRSAAINRAAEGEWDVAVILDGDTILDIDQVTRAAEVADRTGKLVLPFKTRMMLNRQGTQTILSGYKGSWRRWVQAEEGLKHVSSCVVVPRRLWEQARGFDPRFEGWGGEDDAFHAACKALAGVERLDGFAWHLWHPISPWRDHRTVLYRQALALCKRYVHATSPNAMRALVAEPRTPEQVVTVCLTNGRRDTLAATLASADENLHGPIGRRLVCFDGPDHEAARRDAPGWEVVAMGRSRGYAHAVRGAIRHAVGSGQQWVFWLEDDFTFNDAVDLRAMQQVMDTHHGMVQLSLLRQAWFEHELDAGGIFEVDPAAFEQAAGFVRHRSYWTMNPMLCRRELLVEHEWPNGRDSERWYGQQLFKACPESFGGIVGQIGDEPLVEHIGAERAGVGY